MSLAKDQGGAARHASPANAVELLLSALPKAVSARLTTHEFIRETLRQAVLTGQLPLGVKLVQADLAKGFGVSSTPVRDALRDLQAEGLVKLDLHRGTMVVELEDLDLKNVFEMRELIEPLAFRSAMPNVDEDTLLELTVLHEAMAGQPFSQRWVKLNRQFHQLLYMPCQSTRLLHTISQLQDASVAFVSTVLDRFPHVRQHAVEDHLEMIEAVKAHDYERGTAAIQRHLNTPREAFEKIRAEQATTAEA